MGTIMIIIVVGVLILISITIIWAILVNNKAIKLEEKVSNYYNKIGLAVDKRYKILKQGASIMTQHNENFKETYERIMSSRQQEDNFKQEKKLQEAVKEINILVERYPDIGQVFDSQKLMEDMKEIEYDMLKVQDTYNKEVAYFNSYIRAIPNNIILSGKEPYPYFEIDKEEIEKKDDYTI